MTSNSPPSYAPVSREDSGIGSPFNSPPPNMVRGSPNYPSSPSRSGSTNSLPHHHFGGPSSSSSAASVMSRQSGAPMVLYRLAPHSNEPGSNRSSTVSQSPSLINEDNKYPSYRQPSSPSSSRHRLPGPHAALFSSTPSSTNAPLSQNPPRGLVPYEYDPISDSNTRDDEDDILHDPKYTKEQYRKAVPKNGGLSWRGFQNIGMLGLLVLGMLALFLVFPIVKHYEDEAYVRTVSENIQCVFVLLPSSIVNGSDFLSLLRLVSTAPVKYRTSAKPAGSLIKIRPSTFAPVPALTVKSTNSSIPTNSNNPVERSTPVTTLISKLWTFGTVSLVTWNGTIPNRSLRGMAHLSLRWTQI